jgi:5-methylcytosine-specific restriction endonuclease McrA
MFAFCVGELRFSEEAAYKRIHAARAARRFPAIFPAVADGRLHLSAVVLLAPHLGPENAEELLAAAAHRTKAEIERLLAERFPRPDLPERVRVLPSAPSSPAPTLPVEPTPARIEQHAPGRVEAPTPPPKVAPLSPQRFALQVTIGESTHDKLRRAQALLGHQIPTGNIAEVLDRALDALIAQLERRKFAATPRPRRGKRSSTRPRHIPAEVKREVWQRDGGQCTFVSEAGHRCPERSRLEFDHIDPVARGGQATVERMRLRCRAHNQYAAESVFGAEFMRRKREAARAATTAAGAERRKQVPRVALSYLGKSPERRAASP